MQWFKHLTSSHEDPDISDAWDKFGPIGPLIFWVILEIYGREFSRLNGRGQLTLSWKYFLNKVRTKRKTSENILAFYRERSRILSEIFPECVKIKIPKFLEMSSNWVRREKRRPIEVPIKAPKEAPTKAPTIIEAINKKKNLEKDNYISRLVKKPTQVSITDEDFLSSLKEKFTWVDFETVMVKMDAWLLAHPGRKKTRRFIVNWLNKIEKPIGIEQAKKKPDPILIKDERTGEVKEYDPKTGELKQTKQWERK
jgi:hypothetical protein